MTDSRHAGSQADAQPAQPSEFEQSNGPVAPSATVSDGDRSAASRPRSAGGTGAADAAMPTGRHSAARALIAGLYREGDPIADTKAPGGPIETAWTRRKFEAHLVNPANRRKLKVIIVGTGLAGASAAATLGEGGYHVKSFCYQDSPRRAHSIAAQGGINAAKNYQEDGDSVYRLFYDTVKGGDYRSRESNVYRLAEVSGNIIDQCVAQGVPFAREYGGLLDNRSFGGVQVSRTFYARGQTGQQLLIGAYQALERQVGAGNVETFTRHEMLELVLVDGKARGIIARDMVTGEIETHLADAVVLCSGGYGNVFFLSTNAMGCNVTASWRAHRKGAYFGNPCYTQIHPTCIPVSGDHQSKLTLMSESLRNDGRIWVPKKREDCEKDPREIPEEDRDYYLERIYPSYGNLVPRDIASRQAKNVCDEGRGVGPKVGDFRRGVYLDFTDAISRLGLAAVKEKYGNLFDMYARITGEDPYQVPMRIYPAVHYTMGGLWVDYDLQSSIPGLFVAGEANFSDHGANRLGASALMQGLADGYFVLPNTIRDYLAAGPFEDISSRPEVAEAAQSVSSRIQQLLAINGERSVDSFHKELGNIMWEYCGMERSEEGLRKAVDLIRSLRAEFWRNVRILGTNEELNQSLEKAGRVADFLELGELMCIDALHRSESCGGHFRSESQTEEGEALRNDDEYAYVAAWQWDGENEPPVLHKEDLVYHFIELKQRSYK
jgi:succinate dehydrogenase / fumarate reductase flavoprotein subunit